MRKTAAMALALALGHGAQATAQEAETETTRLDRIVIATGLNKIAIETPQSVTVITEEDIEQEQPTTIGDLFDDVPGVKAIGSDRVLGESFNIRGIGTLGSSDENRLIVRIDGANKFYEQYRMGSLFTEPDLYKRVEVLRGPASSTLYGAGALAGVIDLTTKDASDYLAGDDQWAVRQKLQFNSNVAGFLTSTIGAAEPVENLEVLGALIYRRSSDFKDGDGTTISGSAYNIPSGLAKLGYRFGNDLEHRIKASYQHWITDSSDQDYSQTGTISTFGDVDREVTDQTAIFQYNYTPTGNNYVDIDATFSYSNTEVDQTNATATIPSPLFQDTDYGYETWQGQIDNTSTWVGDGYANFLTVGTQLSWQTRTADSIDSTTGQTEGITFHPGGESRNFGVYAQNELVLWEKLTLIAGLRVDYSELSPDDTVTITSESVSNTGVSPKLAAYYSLSDNWGVFGSVAYTERLPVLDEIYDGSSSNLNLDPEKSFNYEGGVAFSANDVFRPADAFSAKVTVFDNHIRDLIERVSTTDIYYNVGEARIYGVELEAAYEADYAFARAAFTAIRGKNTETDEALNSIPADELALTVGAKIPQYDLALGVRGVFDAGQDRVSGATQPSDGYSVFDVFATWLPDDGLLQGAEVRFGIDNLFDRQYQEHLAGDPGKGRTFKVSFAKTF